MPQPLELIRKRILQKVQEAHNITIDELVEIILDSHEEYYTYADVKEIILDMVDSKRLTSADGILKINDDFVKTPEDVNYEINKPVLNQTKFMTGETKIVSVGSEDFFFNFAGQTNGDKIIVELVPEPSNAYDENAIAIMYNNKVLGYMERRYSKTLQESIISLNKKGFKAETNAEVHVSEEMDGLHYLSMML